MIEPGQLRVIDEHQIVYTVTICEEANLMHFEKWACILISDPGFSTACQYGDFWISDERDRLLVGN